MFRVRVFTMTRTRTWRQLKLVSHLPRHPPAPRSALSSRSMIVCHVQVRAGQRQVGSVGDVRPTVCLLQLSLQVPLPVECHRLANRLAQEPAPLASEVDRPPALVEFRLVFETHQFTALSLCVLVMLLRWFCLFIPGLYAPFIYAYLHLFFGKFSSRIILNVDLSEFQITDQLRTYFSVVLFVFNALTDIFHRVADHAMFIIFIFSLNVRIHCIASRQILSCCRICDIFANIFCIVWNDIIDYKFLSQFNEY